jgi:lysophospholipase L1-like esterase
MRRPTIAAGFIAGRTPLKRILAIWFLAPGALGALVAPAQEERKASRDFPITDGDVVLAPYVWKCSGTGESARAEAAMPGAYLKALVRGSENVALLVDGAANAGSPAAAMPIIDYSVDGNEFKSTQLSDRNEVYSVPLASGLDAGRAHRIDVIFRSAKLEGRWESTKQHLRVAGFRLGEGGALLPRSRLPKRAIAFGDSITEGVSVGGFGPYYANLYLNNAGATWVPVVCNALRSEYGQLGTGGQGMVRPIQIPPLPKTWDRYDALSSRLTDGLLLPEPDYVFCLMGTNDGQELAPGHWRLMDISAEYEKWLASVRGACPKAAIFCITPPLGLHATEISEAVEARESSGDRRVYLIDTAPLKDGFTPIVVSPESRMYSVQVTATQLASDGVHPSVFGNAMLGALIAAEVSRQIPFETPQGNSDNDPKSHQAH